MGIKSFFSKPKTLIGNQEMINKTVSFITRQEEASKEEVLKFIKDEAAKEVSNNTLRTLPKEREFLELYNLVTDMYNR